MISNSEIIESNKVTRNDLLKDIYAALDTEYIQNQNNCSKPYSLFAASIIDSHGNAKVRHVSDFDGSQPEKRLVLWLMEEILKYRLTIGWYSRGVRLQNPDGSFQGKDSDLKVIDTVCKYYNIPSIVAFTARGIPYIRGYEYRLCGLNPYYRSLKKFDYYYHIDLFQVYKKPIVRSIIYHNKYRDLSLDSVCKAILVEGKFENLDGSQIQQLSKEKQLEYVSQDARLVMKLSKHENYEILDLMNAISIITKVYFDRICHTEISSWWTKIINDRLIEGAFRRTDRFEKRKYSGGEVIQPKIGFYHEKPVYVFDVKSLYPSMMIEHNISFDTVNCDCCKDDPEARVSDEVMILINRGLKSDKRRDSPYWICKNPNYRGITTKILSEYRDLRFKHQELGNESMQLALKNLINGIYGLYGSEFFQFSDYRVAELTTAFGKLTLQYLQYIAKQVYGFRVIYGDTDSIFVTNVRNENDILKFKAECSILLNEIEVEVSNVYKKFLISKKKHYIGIHQDENKDPDIKGMEGIKSDRPLWINKIERQFANDIMAGKDPRINIRKEYVSMEEGLIPLDDLGIKLTLKKNPQDYTKNSMQRVLGLQSNLDQGNALKYYKSDVIGGGTSNPNLISRRKYLDMLRTTVEDSLKVMGYDFLHDIVGYRKIRDYIN